MILQELQIEGFRSLKSVTWKPGRLNVLIGPNGGGKSNLLRSLDLLRIAATGGLRDAIIGMGGMAPLVWDGRDTRVRLAVSAFDENSSAPNWRYQVIMNRLGSTGGFEEESQPLRKGTERLKNRVKAWSIHNDMRVDQNAELRRATVTRSERRVHPDGQNLIAVLHTLYENDRGFEEFLDKAMSAAFPDDYDKLSFPPAEHGRTEMRVRRKHRKGTDSPADLSDGTLRFLLLATILGSTDPAPLIAIDEPEAGLHPRMMSIIAEIAANAAIKSQVIFTTHSPEFLDAFGDELPVVTVVTSNGSETELKNIEGEELKRWVADYSLGKFAFSGEAEIAS